MDRKLIAKISNFTVPRFGTGEFTIKQLANIQLSDVIVLADGKDLIITAAGEPDKYKISCKGIIQANSIIDIEIYLKTSSTEPEKPAPPIITEPTEPAKSKTTFKIPGTVKRTYHSIWAPAKAKYKDGLELHKKVIREAEALKPKGLTGKRVLTFDEADWPRVLGMIQKAKQLEFQLGMPLYKYYDRITGQGNGAILAAAIAAGISFERLIEWWRTDWKYIYHSNNPVDILKKGVKHFLKPSENVLSHKKAYRALKRLFSIDGKELLLRMSDVKTQLCITVMQGDLKGTVHDSEEIPDMALVEIVCDSAVTRTNFDSKETIKGEAIFLGVVEKNDVLGMAMAQNNNDLELTSIGTPVRVDPEKSLSLNSAGHKGMALTIADATFHIQLQRTEQVIKKLNSLGMNIKYIRFECDPLDDVILNSTTTEAERKGLNSGSGMIALPEWKKEKRQYIAG